MRYVYTLLLAVAVQIVFSSSVLAVPVEVLKVRKSPAYNMDEDWKVCSTSGIEDSQKFPDCITYPESGKDYTTCENAPEAIYFVRHAEKRFRDITGTNNKQQYILSEVGQDMARHLAKLFDPVPVKVVYASDWTRTRQTACPLMRSKKIERHVVCKTETKSERFLLEALCKSHKDEVVVIVGHADTVNEMLINLKVTGPRDNLMIELGKIYKVTFENGKGKLHEPFPSYWKCDPSDCYKNGGLDVKLD